MARHVTAIDRELHDLAAGRNKRLIIQMPPRHGKSELCSKYFPAWYLGTFPERSVILASATDELAMDFSVAARDLLTEHGHLFGTQIRSDRASAQRWATTAGGGLRAAGVGGAIMGRGADLLIIDDYFRNVEEALSETIRRKMYQWYLSTARTRLSPTGVQVIIATRWHNNDLIGEVLKTAAMTGEEWRVVSFPAINDDGAALWPEQWPLSLLEPLRRNYYESGYPWQWEALYQQQPPETMDAEWEPAYFNSHIWFDEWPHRDEILWKVESVDPSLGRTPSSDYSAIVMAALAKDGLIYIDADLQRRDIVRLARDTLDWHQVFNADTIAVEVNGFLAIDELMRSMAGAMMPPIASVTQHNNKLARIKLWLTPYLAQGRLRFKRKSPGVALLIEQLKGFPAHKYDDGPDALATAIKVIGEMESGNGPDYDPSPSLVYA